MGKRFIWTEDRDTRLRQLYKQRRQWKVIAEELGCNSWVAQKRADVLSIITPRPPGRITTSYTLPRDMAAHLEKYARDRGLTKSRVVENALKRELGKEIER